MSVFSDVRACVGSAIYTTAAGADAVEKRERIRRTPGSGWCPPDLPIRRVHDNASRYPGGIRALHLQSLHPLATAAVPQHSGYRSDVRGRLARTGAVLATTTSGAAEDAQRVVDVVRPGHARVVGTAGTGGDDRAPTLESSSGETMTASMGHVRAHVGAIVVTVAMLVGVVGVGSPAAAATSGSPRGNLERVVGVAGAIELSGWAFDPDTTSSIYVWVTVDGAGRHLYANTSRADVAAAFPGQGTAHGFVGSIPASGGAHTVCVTASNVGAGAHTPLGCSTVTVGTPTAPAAGARPNADTTGVPAGTNLRVHNGNLMITAAGTVVDGLDVTGTIIVKADNVTIRNTRVRGVTSNTYTTPLVWAQNGNRNLLVQDSELIPSNPSAVHYGIIGWNFTLERVEIAKVVDGVHIIGSNTIVRSSYIHDVRAYTVNGSTTHSDGVQIQVGSNHRLVNNTIEGGYNAAIQVTQDRGVTSDLQVTGNYMDGGLCSVNLAEKAYGPLRGVVISGNTFGRNTRVYDCAVVNPITTTLSVSNNYFTDGVAIRVRKA